MAGFGPHEIDLIINAYQQTMEGMQGKEKYNFALSGLPNRDRYKLFIDRERLQNPDEKEKKVPPHFLFDVEEPGYFSAMTKAFEFMSEQIGKPITLDLILALHDTAIEGVKNPIGRPFLKGLSRGNRGYGTDPNKFLKSENRQELLDSNILISKRQFSYEIRPDTFIPCQFDKNLYLPVKQSFLAHLNKLCIVRSHASGNREEVEKKIAPYLDHYQSQISRVRTIDGKLMAIGELLRALEIYHIFLDGNQRTFAFLLLNQLLIENNLPPAILDDPLMFDGYFTVKEMSEMIKKGIVNYLEETSEYHREFLNSNCRQSDRVQRISFSHMSLSPSSDYTPFFADVEKGRISRMLKEELRSDVNFALETQSNLDQPLDWTGYTLLGKAILLKDVETVQRLLENGANPLAKLKSFVTPTLLSLALKIKEIEIAQILMNYVPKNIDGYEEIQAILKRKCAKIKSKSNHY
jgi:hypothetical protein